MNIVCIYITVLIKYRFLAADLLHAAKSLEDLSLNGGFGVSFSGKLPLESTTVDIAGICSLIRILFIGIIIETSDFIGAVKHRDPGLGKHICVKHQILADTPFQLLVIFFKKSSLDPAHGSSSSAEAGILSYRVIIIELSAAVASRMLSCKEIIQVTLMGWLIHAPVFQGGEIKSPADIVMAAEIIQEGVLLRKAVYNIHLFFQKADITSGNAVPGCSHGCYIVKHMAFRLLYGSEIGNNLLRLHNDLTQKYDTWADDLGDHTHHTNDRMHLLQVTARSSQFLPDIRNRIDTDHVHSLVCKEEEVVHHLIENTGIAVVQIPLVRIKGSHDIVTDIRKPGKVPRSSGWEYLWYGLFVLVRDLTVVVEEVTAHIFAVTLACFFGPLMILGGVVHNKIHTQVHSVFVAFICKGSQVLHGTKVRADFAEVGYCVTTVGTALRSVQKRHQMQAVHVAFLKIWKLGRNSLDVAGKIVNIEHHAKHILLAEPVRIFFSFQVAVFESAAACCKILVHLVAELCKHIVIVIKLCVQPSKLVVMMV